MKVKRLIELKPVSIKNPCITGELQARDHCFVRYGDDCSIYVKSEKSSQRVMETVTDYIETKLKLKVNRAKSKVSDPYESTLLGFSFYRSKEGWAIRIAPKSIIKIKKKMKEQTKRKDPAPQWKRPYRRRMALQKLGINPRKAYEWSNSRKGPCRVAHSPILCRSLNNAYFTFTRHRYVGFANYYFWKTGHQTKLF